MFEVRIHGRGGQGTVTGAEMLSIAAFLDGKYAQAFPSFGSDRTGDVAAFCRMANREIRLREPVLELERLIIQDATLLKAIDVFQGLRGNGWLLVNTNKSFAELHIDAVVARLPKGHAVIPPASELALKHIGRPLRAAPQPTGEFETLEADSVAVALGQDVDLSLLEGVPGLEIRDGEVVVGPNMTTGSLGIFAGGDMVPSERTVTVAIRHGKKAARHINAWLDGDTYRPAPKHEVASFDKLITWYLRRGAEDHSSYA